MPQPNQKPKIFGHRGAAGLVFENTLASIEKAIDLGVAGVELDVWKTTDGELIVFHDPYLHRLTDSKGFTAEMSYAQLQQIRLTNGDPIPTLQQVVDLVKKKKTVLLVEVKAENAFADTFDMLRAELPFKDFIMGSFYHEPIRELKKTNPDQQTAIMFECLLAGVENYLEMVNPDFVIPSIETYNQRLLETVRDQNRNLLFYTVNTEAEIALALKAQPYGFITNFPDKLLEITK